MAKPGTRSFLSSVFIILTTVLVLTGVPALSHASALSDLELYVLSKASWVENDVKKTVRHFNKTAEEYLETDPNVALVFIVLKYRGKAVAAVAHREDSSVVVTLNYQPLPFDRASMNQSIDATISTKLKNLQLLFPDAVEQKLLMKGRSDHLMINSEELCQLLGADTSPFEEVVEIR